IAAENSTLRGDHVGQLCTAAASATTSPSAFLSRRAVRFDDRVHHAIVSGEGRESDASFIAARQAIVQLRPGRAAVHRAINSAAGTAAVVAPAFALVLIHRGVKNLRILRVYHEIDRASVLVLIENLLPRLASVAGFENAAFGVRSPEVPGSGNVDDIRI